MSFEVPEAQRLAALYNLGQMDIPIEPRLMQHIKVAPPPLSPSPPTSEYVIAAVLRTHFGAICFAHRLPCPANVCNRKTCIDVVKMKGRNLLQIYILLSSCKSSTAKERVFLVDCFRDSVHLMPALKPSCTNLPHRGAIVYRHAFSFLCPATSTSNFSFDSAYIADLPALSHMLLPCNTPRFNQSANQALLQPVSRHRFVLPV